jgi:hypothetical protein
LQGKFIISSGCLNSLYQGWNQSRAGQFSFGVVKGETADAVWRCGCACINLNVYEHAAEFLCTMI